MEMACLDTNIKKFNLDAGNSGTAARLLCSVLIDTNHKIKITGDSSLKKET